VVALNSLVPIVGKGVSIAVMEELWVESCPNAKLPPWMNEPLVSRWKIELLYEPDSAYARKFADVIGASLSNSSTSNEPCEVLNWTMVFWTVGAPK